MNLWPDANCRCREVSGIEQARAETSTLTPALLSPPSLQPFLPANSSSNLSAAAAKALQADVTSLSQPWV